MRFKRPQVITHIGTGQYQNGEQTTTATETQTAMEHLVLGNGSAKTTVYGGGPLSVTSQILPIAAATPAYVSFDFNIEDNRQVFANVFIKNFGSGGMSELRTLIEFQDPHYPEFWIPSLEGVSRTTGTQAGHHHVATAVGNYIVASRQEHRHFRRVRFSFQADLAIDAATEVWVTWHNDGAPSRLSDVQNSDTAKVWE